MKTELPVRSAELKHRTGGLVVTWVTGSEYLLSYVFCSFRIVLYLSFFWMYLSNVSFMYESCVCSADTKRVVVYMRFRLGFDRLLITAQFFVKGLLPGVNVGEN
jgi:hypothetical protein